jgi:hypothetical protein
MILVCNQSCVIICQRRLLVLQGFFITCRIGIWSVRIESYLQRLGGRTLLYHEIEFLRKKFRNRDIFLLVSSFVSFLHRLLSCWWRLIVKGQEKITLSFLISSWDLVIRFASQCIIGKFSSLHIFVVIFKISKSMNFAIASTHCHSIREILESLDGFFAWQSYEKYYFITFFNILTSLPWMENHLLCHSRLKIRVSTLSRLWNDNLCFVCNLCDTKWVSSYCVLVLIYFFSSKHS